MIITNYVPFMYVLSRNISFLTYLLTYLPGEGLYMLRGRIKSSDLTRNFDTIKT